MGAPLTVGYGEGENYLGSDALALAPLTQRIAYLDEGDWAVVTPRRRRRSSTATTSRSSARSSNPARRRRAIEKGNYRHFMQKEIFEQPIVVAQTLQSYVRPFEGEVALPDRRLRPRQRRPRHDRRLRHQLLRRHGRQILVRAVRARAGRHRCRVRVPLPRAGARAGRAGAVHLASRARPPTRSPRCATREPRGRRIAVVVNVPTSSMAREADLLLPTHAGPEIGVASTKAFTCQLAVLAALAANLARAKGRLSARGGARDRRAICRKRPRRSTPRSAMTRTSRRWRT